MEHWVENDVHIDDTTGQMWTTFSKILDKFRPDGVVVVVLDVDVQVIDCYWEVFVEFQHASGFDRLFCDAMRTRDMQDQFSEENPLMDDISPVLAN
jgi:hypothetical protein